VTPNEIQMLIVGIALGAQSMNVFHIVLDSRAARRSNAAAQRQARVIAADRFLSSLRLYQLQHRSRA